MTPLVTARKAFTSKALLGTVLGDPTWQPWRTLLIAGMGEALTDEERLVFSSITGGREVEPQQRVDEIVGVVGRCGGKSRAVAAAAVYLGCLCDHSANLSIGERGVVLVLAATQKQARVCFGYIAGILESVPQLAKLVANRTADTIELANGIDIEIRAVSSRGLRGVTAVAVIGDESAFWNSDEGSVNSDTEVLNAIRPALATTGGMLILISSPHARRGEFWSIYKTHFGPQGDKLILVAQGASRDFNSTLPQSVVDRAMERDPSAASAEYLAQFRTDIETFASPESVEASTFPGRLELPPIPGITYYGFVDAAGGSGGGDSMTLAIAHAEGPVAVLDLVRERKPPFSPDATVKEFGVELKRYWLREIVGDRWASGFVSEAFQKEGFKYQASEKPKSDIYRDLLPILNSKRVELLDVLRLRSQLLGLERRTARGGKDNVDHAPGARDDIINSAAGALVIAAGIGRGSGFDMDVYLKCFS